MMDAETPAPPYGELRTFFEATDFYVSNGADDSYANGTLLMTCRTCGALTDEGEGMATHWRYHQGKGEL